MTILLSLIKLLPLVLSLINRIADYAKSAQDRGIGRDQAVLEALTIANEQLAAAQKAREAAAAEHARKPGDDAFDDEFKRDSV